MGKGASASDSARLVYVNERDSKKQNDIKTEKIKTKKITRGNNNEKKKKKQKKRIRALQLCCFKILSNYRNCFMLYFVISFWFLSHFLLISFIFRFYLLDYFLGFNLYFFSLYLVLFTIFFS